MDCSLQSPEGSPAARLLLAAPKGLRKKGSTAGKGWAAAAHDQGGSREGGAQEGGGLL